jgi:enediyne biosynthesis protein E4
MSCSACRRGLIFIALSTILFAQSCKEKPRFELLDSSVTGIDFNNLVLEEDTFNIMRNEYMYNGGGVGIGDLNNDGLQDIVFTGNKVNTHIYLNNGNFSFKNISENFRGLKEKKQWLSGVCIVDINADGWNDLYFTSTMNQDSTMRKNQLWINQGLKNGEPYFEEQAEDYGIADMGYSMHAAFFDYDLDGDLDLYVLNNIINKAVPTNYRTKITDGSAVNNDHFYENLGNGKFKDITIAAGIVYEGYGLGIAVGDVNKDNYPDLYISNDYIANDLLYINQKNGTFKNQSKDFISYQSRFSMGNDMADFNNDGNLDIITLDMMPEKYSRKKQTINGNSYMVYVNNEQYGYEPQSVRNMVHLHNGFQDSTMLPFSEVGQIAGVFQTEWSWSPLFADFDNDGDKDLFITNGFPKDLTDKDFTNYKAQVYGSLADDAHMISRIPIVKVSNYAYENKGTLRFQDKTAEWGMKLPSFSNGAAFADLDNDGDLDYLVNNINAPAFVYRNNSNAMGESNFIRIDLRGNGANIASIGAKVEVWSGGTYQYSEKFLSRGYLSSIDPVFHFGLGKSKVIDSIHITWPTGALVSKLRNVKPNQKIEIKEAEAELISIPLTQDPFLFRSIKGKLDYTHSEKDLIDFFFGQNILPHKYSMLGPCIAKCDVNGDGRKDLIIGASNTEPTKVYLNKLNGFVLTDIQGLSGRKTGQESDIQAFDFDNDGDEDLIILSGEYLGETEDSRAHNLYENRNGIFLKSQLPIPSFHSEVARPFDFDHDGDIDIFIGSRVKQYSFPKSENSYLLINDKGSFKLDSALIWDAGMVTDAVWSDYDNDGWEDLLLAREWNTLAIIKNESGKRMTLNSFPGGSTNSGSWFSIRAGDFDNDGDQDYIAGNLGHNHRFTISNEYPMRAYSVDLDKNGFIDPVTTAYWKDDQGIMQEYIINYLDELAAQSPFFRKMFTSYTNFSRAPAKEIINQDTIKNKVFINTTASFILWNESGNFKWQELPEYAQTSPIKTILVKDFNFDGYDDALLGGNDFSFDVSTGYYNANKGIILLGGDKVSILHPSKSGILLDGQVESLLYLEGDTTYVVAGINRKEAKVFEHIKPKRNSKNKIYYP